MSFDPIEKIWRGPKMDVLFGPECTIGGEVLKTLMKDPDHIAQISYTSGKEYTNREIASLSVRVAQHFRDHLKIPQCEVVGLCASNTDYVAPLYFGAMLAGLTVSTLDPSFDKDGIKHIYSLTRPKVMFCDGNIYERVKQVMQEIGLDITIYTMNNHIEGVPEITEFIEEIGNEDAFVPDPLKEGWNQTAVIICSSGSTGLPKGVCLSHASLLNLKVTNIRNTDFTFRSFFNFSTLYWISGLNSLLRMTLDSITRIITENSFNTTDFFNIVEKYKVECILTPPSQLALVLADPQLKKRDLSSIKVYLCGGSAVPMELIEKIRAYLQPNASFRTAYGMSEATGVSTYCLIPRENCAGVVTPNVEVKIIDDEGNRLGPNERGEICVRNKFPWAGYYKNPEATAATYIDGWVHSGDIGYFDDEANLFIVDRKKEILKYNNFHFSPTEIEAIIYGLKDVVEVSVCGIPDVVASFLPAAAVVRVPGSKLTEKDVFDHVARTTAHFKHLHGGVYFVDELPKTVSGKNIRKSVTDICIRMRQDAMLA